MKNNLAKYLETILDAAEEGLRNCESDSSDGVKGADETLGRYEAALAKADYIRRAVNSHDALLKIAVKFREYAENEAKLLQENGEDTSGLFNLIREADLLIAKAVGK